jgi:hypothetical protein
MINLFQDESGDCSFSANSLCRNFLITVLSISPSDAEKLKRLLKRRIAFFISKGWPKDKEPKAFALNKDIRFGQAAICNILKTLVTIPTLGINYIVVNKAEITNQSFISAPYGTAYNYFTGILLSEMIFQDNMRDVHLICNTRNKETHTKRHFQEYLKTKIYGMALENNVNVNIVIKGEYSHKCYGLLAADYFSWAIFRKFERDDDSFFKLFENKLSRRREWYIKK